MLLMMKGCFDAAGVYGLFVYVREERCRERVERRTRATRHEVVFMCPLYVV